MKLPDFGVRRPMATLMLFGAIIALGLYAMVSLPLDLLPSVELPTLTVITVYPGASANEVEEQVTRTLEASLAGAEGLQSIKSSSQENVSFIQLQYSWGADIAAASINARDLIEPVKSKLPSSAYDPMVYKLNASMMPVLGYSVHAEASYNGLEQIVEDQVASRLRKVEGVGGVRYLGQPTREIKVEIDPTRANAYGITVSTLARALKADNINVPAGSISIGGQDMAVRMPGKIESVEEIENTVLAGVNGRMVKVRDVATVTDGFKEKEAFARNHLGRGMTILIQKQSGANTVAVADAVRTEMEQIKKTLPADVQLYEVASSDLMVRHSVNSLTSSILYALLFVTLVVLLFLRDWKSSFIVFVTMPVSLIAAFIVMYLLDFTINIFSLISLVVAIGMVVDNAIVVLENITQHIEHGARPKEAARFGASEMGLAIAASTATTIVVFFPLLFMGGIVGVMFKQLAILTVTCLLVSLFTALTLTPMLASVMLKPAPRGNLKPRHGRLYQWSERGFERLENGYKNLLGWAVHHKTVTLISALVIFVVTMILGKSVGTDYIPNIDTADLSIIYETEQGTSSTHTDSVGKQILDIIREQVPEMEDGAVLCVAGRTSDGTLTALGFKESKNIGSILCHLKPIEERDRTGEEIAAALQPYIEALPEVTKATVSGGSALAAILTGNKEPVEYLITGHDLQKLHSVAFQLVDSMNANNAFKNVETSANSSADEIHVEINKAKAAALALNATVIGVQLRENLYGASAGALTEEGTDYDIVVRYDKASRNSPEALRNMSLTNLLGEQVPLGSVATISMQEGATEITHDKQQRYVKVSASPNGISLGDAAKEARAMLIRCSLPEGVNVSVAGQVSEQETSFQSLYFIFFLGILLVFMVMAAQFESLLDPFIILFAIPFTLVGVILIFAITGVTLSVVTFVGVVTLVGIVVNNGIVLVDYTNMLLKRGRTLQDAVMEAGRSRLRPVLMTSLTTILGMVPMALNKGMGTELYSPFGLTVIGGLLVSTIVTLLVVPTMYASLHARHDKIARRQTLLRIKLERKLRR